MALALQKVAHIVVFVNNHGPWKTMYAKFQRAAVSNKYSGLDSHSLKVFTDF